MARDSLVADTEQTESLSVELKRHPTPEEQTMGIEQAPTEKGREAARGLRKSAAKDEKKTEANKGSDLAKGADRFEERSKSSDGKSAGTKQRG